MVTGEVEQRDLTQSGPALDPEEIAERCAAASDRLPGSHRIVASGRNRLSGTPERLRSEDSRAEPVSDRALIPRALEHLRSVEAALARPGEVLEWVPEPRVHSTSSGVRLVRLRQTCRGIPVFEAMRTVRFDPGGTVREVTGDHVPLRGDLDLAPDLSAGEAVLRAARHLAETVGDAAQGAGIELRVTDHPPRHRATFPLPAAPALYEKPPFVGSIPVHSTLFFLAPEVRLGWFLSLSLPERGGVYDVIVDAEGADAGEVLWCRRCTAHSAPARGAVFLHHPEEAGRAVIDFPPPVDAYPPLRPRRPLPPGFPRPWVTDRRTSGPNALSRRGRKSLEGRLEQGSVVFESDPPEGEDQRVLNAFYVVNYLHDLFYLLGFDEAEGNFQEVNPPGVAAGGDRVEIGVFEIVLGEASMEPTADGNPPRMSLGTTTEGRHTALDADVVVHELVHGITDRIVGGGDVTHPMSRTLQSRALDEGTCDYFALTIESYRRLGLDPPGSEHLVHAAWAGGEGRRSYEDLGLRFGDLRGVSEPHRAGQVWGGALLSMNRRLGQAVGDARRGHELGWQIVVDALKLLEVTPLSISFLAGRGSILEAFEMMRSAPPARADGAPLLPPDRHTEVEGAIRNAFLDLGMGPAASGTGPGFDDVVQDPAT